MPEKIKTETQFARLIGATPLQIEFTLLRVSSHVSKNTSKEHLENFYKTFDNVRDNKYDGLIITGAPIEHLPFEAVDYWGELKDISALAACTRLKKLVFKRQKITSLAPLAGCTELEHLNVYQCSWHDNIGKWCHLFMVKK
mgnify:CR=1 FL=1